MIDPKRITNFDRTDSELETFWLFCIMVAGKNSDTVSRTISKIFHTTDSPFDILRELGEIGIHNMLDANRVGQYNRISKAFNQSLSVDLRHCNIEDLLSIYGVGPKTARFFLLHTRRDCTYAVLDTHILKWIKNHGIEDAPSSTPQNPKTYSYYERIFHKLASSYFPNMTMADVDLLIWTEQSGRLDENN